MPQGRRPAYALALALAAACVPDQPAEITTAATSSTAAAGGTDTDGATSTTAASTTAATSSTASGESTEAAETAAETAAAPGCGDGVAAPGEVCFDRVTPFEGAYFTHLALADLDGDGHLDLLATSLLPCPLVHDDDVLALRPAPPSGAPRDGGSAPFVYTALGDGAGGFGPLDALALTYADLGAPVVGDFTGDGRLDLAAGVRAYDEVDNVYLDQIVVLPGDGAGGFSAPIETSAPIAASELAAGDLDGDGHLDLVTASYHGLSVLRGDGLGGFAAAFMAPASTFHSPLLRDLDGDGALDLLVLRDPVDSALEAHRGLGDGTFSLSQVIPIDGALLDLALLDPAQGSRPVALITSYKAMVGRRLDAAAIDVDGALGPLELVPGVDGERLAVGRFDGAPRPDLLVAGGGASSLVLGEEPWPPPPLPLGGDPLALHGRPAVGDLNEDGLDDLALLADGLLLLLLLSNP